MIIKKLILKSFGKFQNKTIDLQSGMNLFLGENESGKSTLHQFIEGMFYGFYKQNIKNKKTTEAYDKFMPWDNLNDFSGVMIIEDEGRELRIERTFMKNRDLVQIFDNLTGQNITETYPYDPVTKIHQPALKHLGLSQSAYQNTVSISQQKSRTSEELADEIKDNIINLGDTRRVDVSISNIMKILAERKAVIGTQRSKKSNFGKTKEMIGQMENEKMDTGKIWDEIKQLRLQENHLTIDLQALEKNKQRIERKMAFLKDQDGKEIYEKVRQISLELADISNKLVEMSPYANISKDEINDVLIKLNNSDFLKREYDQQVEKVGEMRDRLRSLEAEVLAIDGVIIEIGASEKISRDVYKFEEFENSKKYTGQSVEPDKKLQLEEVLLKKKKTKKVLKVFYVMTMVFTLLFAITKFMEYFGKSLFENIAALQSIHETIVGIVSQLETYSLYTWGGALLMLILTVVLMIVSGQKKSDIKQLEIQKQALLESEEISLNRIKDIDERQALLLSKHACTDLEALKALRDKKVKEELMYEDNYKRARALEDEKEMIEHRLGNEQDKLRQLQLNLEKDMDWIQEVMTKLNLWSDEELKESLQQYDYYKQLESEKQNKEYVLHEITKGKSYLNLDIHEILDEFKDKVAEEEFSEDEFSEETFQEPQEYYEEVASSQERTVENEVENEAENEVEHEVENEAENFESNFGIINYHEEALDNNFYGASLKEETMIANSENYDDLETQLRNLN
ncbi:MAG: AAA family ATPase, partial [Vallitaleaceae bacterium]|nr:AAA family ATPase [Vallitaleaceae bacterium]